MEAYLKHVTQPNNKVIPFAKYNKTYKSNLSLNTELENKAKTLIKQAKAQFGPNEVVPMSYFHSLMSSCKKDKDGKAGKISKKLPVTSKQSLSDVLKEQNDEKTDNNIFASLKNVNEEVDKVKCDVCEKENCSGHAEDIEFEDEYDIEDHNVFSEVKDFLAQSLSGKELMQAQNHVVYFNRKNGAMEDKLMKGKDRYMKALQSYMKGDNSVEVRLMSKEKVKVADLKLNMDSLKALLHSSPGKPRICECDA